MKRLLLLTVLVLVVVLAAATPALAADDLMDHCASGQDFGQHVSDMAQQGMLGADHNPGMHQGFSDCLSAP